MRLRPATHSDRDEVVALAVAEEDVWFGQAENSAEDVGEWIDSEGGVALGVVVVDPAGRIRGFGSPGRHGTVYFGDPAETAAVADLLLPWLLQRGRPVEVLTFGADAARVAAFERHGLRHLRSSFTLVRPAAAGPVTPVAFPDGVEVAPYRFGDDDEAVHRLIYVEAGFGAVEGHTERDLDDWREKDRRCGSLFLARRDGRPVGWVAGRVLENGRGDVTTLAVAGSERGRGVGRALLLHAFADLQRDGASDLILGVEAGNAAALGLYRSVGLEVEREWRIYAPG